MACGATELSSIIRQEALQLGFFKAGLARSGPLPHGDRLSEWLKSGFHGEMRYMQRQEERRLNPELVLPCAKSLVVLGFNYFFDSQLPGDRLIGTISRYAAGNDYHTIIKNKLEQLLAIIKKYEPAANGRCFVDAGPVSEKTWGAQTSLGWIGKNSNLIARGVGSWFFIGVILLDIELDYDLAEEDFCGKCKRCLESCPTGAIVRPYVLDARLCISYLTIEFRGIIPVPIRGLMGNRIFGCDDCQAVCPWNRFAVKTSEKWFHPNLDLLSPDLASFASITNEQFMISFANSPILRAGRDGFVRNIMIALGNSDSKRAVPVLQRALLDPSSLVRIHAEWALNRLSSL